MFIRHFGIYVKDIDAVEKILFLLGGVVKTYDEIETVNGQKANIRKYYFESCGSSLEFVQGNSIAYNSFHICYQGDVPEFMKKFKVVDGTPFDPKIKLFFVYIQDAIYFEFARRII